MKKIETFGSLEKINGRLKVKTTHILEATLYMIFNCYIYSYQINEGSIEYILAGDDIEDKRIMLKDREGEIKIKGLIEKFNYLADFENSLFKGGIK